MGNTRSLLLYFYAPLAIPMTFCALTGIALRALDAPGVIALAVAECVAALVFVIISFIVDRINQ